MTTKWREWTKKARKCFEISISSVERTNRCLHLSVSSLFCFALRLCRHENAQIQVFISVLFSVVSRCPLNLHSRSQCQWRERMKAKRTESRKYWTRMQVTNAKARVRFPWQVVSLNAKPKKKNCNQWRRDDNTFYYCHFFSSFWVRENSIFRSLSMAVFSIAVSIQSLQIGKQTNAENSFQQRLNVFRSPSKWLHRQNSFLFIETNWLIPNWNEIWIYANASPNAIMQTSLPLSLSSARSNSRRSMKVYAIDDKIIDANQFDFQSSCRQFQRFDLSRMSTIFFYHLFASSFRCFTGMNLVLRKSQNARHYSFVLSQKLTDLSVRKLSMVFFPVILFVFASSNESIQHFFSTRIGVTIVLSHFVYFHLPIVHSLLFRPFPYFLVDFFLAFNFVAIWVHDHFHRHTFIAQRQKKKKRRKKWFSLCCSVGRDLWFQSNRMNGIHWICKMAFCSF